MRRLLLSLITALLTFYWSVFFTQLWQRRYPAPHPCITATLTSQEVKEDTGRGVTVEEVKARLVAVEEKYWRCAVPHPLVKTKEEAEKKRSLCYLEWIRTNRIILEEESPR